VNVRITLDIPTHWLPRLENSLARAGLQIQPYIKHGLQRWTLAAKSNMSQPSIPDTLLIVPPGVE
jgi:hypothetical protein